MSKGKIVEVHEDAVVIKSRNSSRTQVADIIAKEVDEIGCQIIYLRSLVHSPKDEFVGFDATGCISTILTAHHVF